MEAKVKDSARFKSYQFFSGREYVKGDWRPVPVGYEEQARAEPMLDVRNGKQQPIEKVEKLPVPVLPVEDYEYMKEKKYPKRGRKRKDESGESASSEVED